MPALSARSLSPFMHHKYGFHCNRTGNDVFDAFTRLRPAVVKLLDPDRDFVRELRRLRPDVWVLGRLVVPAEEQARFVENPAAHGVAFAERLLRHETSSATWNGQRLLDAWEAYNEPLSESTSTAEQMRRYDDFQVAFGERLRREGLEPVGMNFATGNLLGSHFLRYFPGTLESYTWLGFHEYDWPTLWRLHEENIRDKGEGGMWLALRYRRVMELVRQVYGDKHKVLITECGLTQGVIPGRLDVGWRAEPAVTEESYWQSLLWYNRELLRDPYVQAALLFVVGAISPWQSFEHLGGIMERLIAYQAMLPPTASLRSLLLDEAQRQQRIQFNPQASLQQRIFADDFVPNSPEFAVDFAGRRYIAQRAEHLISGAVRVYYAADGE